VRHVKLPIFIIPLFLGSTLWISGKILQFLNGFLNVFIAIVRKDYSSSLYIKWTCWHISGNKMPTRCNRWFLYCRSYCLLNMFRAPLCPTSGAQEYYTGGCCLWYLVRWFSSCRSGVELWVVCLVCGMVQHPGNRTHNPKLKIKKAVGYNNH